MKDIQFLGQSLEAIRHFPASAKREAGYQLDRVQRGHDPKESKMKSKNTFESVWNALEDDPIRAKNLKLRSALIIEITAKIDAQGLTQAKAAKILHITQPRVSALLQGKINDFRLDRLVDMAHRLGLRVSIQFAA